MWRNPTKEEINEVREYYGVEEEDMPLSCFEWCVVLDGYISDCPGYTGKILFYVGGAGPEFHDVLIWNEGKIERAERED